MIIPTISSKSSRSSDFWDGEDLADKLEHLTFKKSTKADPFLGIGHKTNVFLDT